MLLINYQALSPDEQPQVNANTPMQEPEKLKKQANIELAIVITVLTSQTNER